MLPKTVTRFLTFSSLAGPFAGCSVPAPPDVDPVADIARAAAIDLSIEPPESPAPGGPGAEPFPLDAPPVEPGTLTLERATRDALERSPEVRRALAKVRVALLEADQEALLPNPLLSVILRFPLDSLGLDVEAGVSEDLHAILTRPGRVAAAHDRLRAAASGAVVTALDVVAEVKRHYVRVRSLEQTSNLIQERRTLVADLREVARSRLRLGEGTSLDVATLDAQVLQLDLEIQATESAHLDARLALGSRIGRPTLAANWTVEPASDARTIPIDERQWIDAALKSREDLKAIEWRIRALEEAVGVAENDGWLGSEVGAEAESSDSDWSLGPSFAFPLRFFDSGSKRVQIARAELEVAGEELAIARREGVEEVRRACAAVVAASSMRDRVRTELVPLERTRRQQVEQVYLAGQADLSALLLAEQDLRAARERQVELDLQVELRIVELERAVGGPAEAARLTGPSGGQEGGQRGGSPNVP